MAAAHCIYTDEMTGLMHGNPLWEPNCRPREVNIGDVGYIRQGRFCRLFNATLSPGDARNEFGTPDGFERLILDERAMTHRRLSSGAFVSRSVVKSGADIQFNDSVLQTGAGFNFSCKRDRGAALIINAEGLRQDSEQLGAFKKYMLKHSNSWLTFANDPPNSRDILLHDLVFITGRDNTADWAVAAFAERSTSGGVSFQSGCTPIIGATFSVWGSWAGLRSMYSNCGPQLPPITAGPSNLTVTNTSPQSGLASAADLQLYDQCIFMRGFKIMDRKSQVYGMIKLKVSGNANGFGWIKAPLFESKTIGPKVAGGGNSTTVTRSLSMNSNATETSEKDVLMYTGGPDEVSPAEYVLLYILLVSEANVALIHDNDISAIVKACNDYSTFIEALREVVPHVTVDSEGVGSISLDGESSIAPSKPDAEVAVLDLAEIQTNIDGLQKRLTEVRRQLSLHSKNLPAPSLEDPQTIDASSGAATKKKLLGENTSTQGLRSKTPQNTDEQHPPAVKAKFDIIRKEQMVVQLNARQLYRERDDLQKKLKEFQEARRMAVKLAKLKEEQDKERRLSEEALKAELARKERQGKEQQQRLEARARLLARAGAPAFESDRRDCNTLLGYFSRMIAPSIPDVVRDSAGEKTTPLGRDNSPGEGWVPLKNKKKREEEESFFVGSNHKSSTKKSNSKDATNHSQRSSSSSSNLKKVVIPLTIMTLLEKHDMALPLTLGDIPNVMDDIRKKLQWLDGHEEAATASNLTMMEASLHALPLLVP